MTDLAAAVAGLFTNATLGIPLLLLSVVAVFWILSRFNHLPPLFRAIGPDRTWVLGPFARVEQGASAGRLSPAVAYASFRVREVLRSHYGLAAVPSGPFWGSRQRRSEEMLTLIRLCHDLDATYRLAWLSEREEPLDFVTRWRLPRWRRQARARFTAELAQLERVVPALEAIS